jgi:hypothetical protein
MDQAVSLMAQPGVAMHVKFNPVSVVSGHGNRPGELHNGSDPDKCVPLVG